MVTDRPPAFSGMAFARIASVAALALFFLSAAAIVVAGTGERRLARRDVQFIATSIVRFDQDVRTQLARLGPAGTLARTRRHTREAIAHLNALARGLRAAAGSDAATLRLAIAGELRFLDAAGSVLANPGSPLLAQLARLDAVARQGLAALDGPAPRRTGGVSALRRLWHARAAAQT